MGTQRAADGQWPEYQHERELRLKREAAPDLYAALEATRAALDNTTLPDGHPVWKALLSADSALAKARGE